MANRIGPKAPKVAALKLTNLVPVDISEFVAGYEDIEDILADSINCDQMEWVGHRNLLSSIVVDSSFGKWYFPDGFFRECLMKDLRISSFSGPQSTWWNMNFEHCRIGAGDLYSVSWRNLHFTGCKFDYLNLRHANLIDVKFTDCIIEEIDLLEVKAKRCSFDGCRIGKIDLLRTKLEDFDLRGAEIAEVRHIDGLRGATMTFEQLIDFVPTIASYLGVDLQ